MKDKNGAISSRQFSNCLVQGKPVKNRDSGQHVSSADYVFRQFAVFSQLLFSAVIFAKVHENAVDRHAVQPGRECAITPKGIQLAKYQDKDLLSEIFRFLRIPSHP